MKLINKDVLVKEIKGLIDRSEYIEIYDYAFRDGNNAVCVHILNFLDILEVKEVELEKEISNYLDNHNLNIQNGGRIVFSNGDTPNLLCDFRDIAKHFYELGLKAQKGE